jgi:hypothetical protein
VNPWTRRRFADGQGVVSVVLLSLGKWLDVLRRDQRNPIAASVRYRPQ